ncbi:hypothetical protein EVAR_35212_1 [Eumeta japonica]|uniref:Uncharacterized protein n=1 Tax=Eumeta variegata TaxID=151549 RepID=A0A4C1VBV4_EUMVA|nr:hypothetical protein EVAR_35212_1 [Eumeta japonica]
MVVTGARFGEDHRRRPGPRRPGGPPRPRSVLYTVHTSIYSRPSKAFPRFRHGSSPAPSRGGRGGGASRSLLCRSRIYRSPFSSLSAPPASAPGATTCAATSSR